jgi:hypothetical protein
VAGHLHQRASEPNAVITGEGDEAAGGHSGSFSGGTLMDESTAGRGIRPGDCVRLPDGRIGRVREAAEGRYRVRVRRATSKTHQFLWLTAAELQPVGCPKGWMSPEGHLRYLGPTLAKQRLRLDRKRAGGGAS